MSREKVRQEFGDRVVAELEFLIATLDEMLVIVGDGKDELMSNFRQQRTIEACSNRIGDTIRNKIPNALQTKYRGDRNWSSWIDWRVFLSHQYHRIDLEMLWNDLSGDDIPEFRRFLADEVLGG